MDSKFNFEILEEENSILVNINPDLYGLKAVYGAAYNFLDQAYIYLTGDPDEKIEIQLKGKEKLDSGKLEELAGEFLNELVNVKFRYFVSDKNQKIREYVVSTALRGASSELGHDQSKLRHKTKKDEPDWKKDPENISTPWEEKNKVNSQEKNSTGEKPYEENSEGLMVPKEDNE